jgi:glucosamine-6-phosphate deaminase
MRTIHVDADHRESKKRAAAYIVERWFEGAPRILGGATGRTQRGIYQALVAMARERDIDLRNAIALFLDEYVGAYPAYYHYAVQHLRVGKPGGFREEKVHVPRGCFFEDDKLVGTDRLEQILCETVGEWEARTEPSEDGDPPEILIHPHATHPVLQAIRASNLRYEEKLWTIGRGRLQLLGVGTAGHIGFVEAGCATPDSNTMLVRLSRTTRRDNGSDFNLRDGDNNEIQIAGARYAVTQGIGSILSAGELLLSAHGCSKRDAVRRMLLSPACPTNPAGFAITHPRVRIFLDAGAFDDLDESQLEQRGFEVVYSSALRTSRAVM